MKKLCLAISLFATLSATAQNIGVNATGVAADTSAMLDVSSGSKGILLPRIALVSSTDAVSIKGPAQYLIVYNTSASNSNGLSGAGLYANTGTALLPTWQRVGTGATGQQGATGPQGPQGPSGIVTSRPISGYAGASIAPSSPVYVFVGPTAEVTLTANQRLLLWGEVPLGLATGSAPTIGYIGAGYQSTVAGSIITNMAGGNFSIHSFKAGRNSYAFAGNVHPGAGTYTIGCIVKNLGITPITDNDYMNAIYMVVDN